MISEEIEKESETIIQMHKDNKNDFDWHNAYALQNSTLLQYVRPKLVNEGFIKFHPSTAKSYLLDKAKDFTTFENERKLISEAKKMESEISNLDFFSKKWAY